LLLPQVETFLTKESHKQVREPAVESLKDEDLFVLDKVSCVPQHACSSISTPLALPSAHHQQHTTLRLTVHCPFTSLLLPPLRRRTTQQCQQRCASASSTSRSCCGLRPSWQATKTASSRCMCPPSTRPRDQPSRCQAACQRQRSQQQRRQPQRRRRQRRRRASGSRRDAKVRNCTYCCLYRRACWCVLYTIICQKGVTQQGWRLVGCTCLLTCPHAHMLLATSAYK
jgi:hypothetical protein